MSDGASRWFLPSAKTDGEDIDSLRLPSSTELDRRLSRSRPAAADEIWSETLNLIDQAAESIRRAEARVEELERENREMSERAADSLRNAEDRLQEAERQIAATERRAEVAEQRAEVAEGWLRRIRNAVGERLGSMPTR